jgi:uncharacterized protein (TIRG00374 family)
VLRSRRFWIGLGFSGAFIALFFARTDPSKFLDALRGADYWWFLPAVVLYMVSLWIRSLRYSFLVRDIARLSARQLFPVLCIAFMANNILPARAGELMRVYVLGDRYGVKRVSALGTVLVERLFDGLTLLLFFLLTVALLGSNNTLRTLAVVSVIVFFAALCVFGVILRWPERSEALAHRLIEVLPGKIRPLARELSTSLLSGMIALRNPTALAVVLISSPLAWLLEAGTFWLVGLSFHLSINPGWFMMAMAAGNLALTAPSTQGGIGPFEFFAKQVLIVAGVSDSVAVAYSLAAHAMIIVPVTALGLIYLSTFHMSLSRANAQAGAEDRDGSEIGPGAAGSPLRSR